MRLGKLISFLFFCIINIFIYSNDLEETDLKTLYENGLITKEDYEILSDNLQHSDGEYLYELRINGELKSKIYKTILKNKKKYFPLKEFFKNINFVNYSIQDKERITLYLGDTLKEIRLSPTELKIDGEKTKEVEPEGLIYENNEIYLEEEIFKEIFLKNIKIDNDSYKMYMYLSFLSPDSIAVRIQRTKEELEENNSENILSYTNNPKLFELGYLRTQFNQIFTKNKTEGDKFKKDWESTLEYQGAALYGQLTTTYDIRNQQFEDVTLRYNDIWESHTLELGSYGAGNGKARELGLSFKKDKGYIITSNKTYIIKENVPIGSRVELLYLGFPIDVKDSENGIVEFQNSEIRSDREYLLKIYEPSGKIEFRKINTTSDYNQQNKGQIEYNIDIKEDDESGKVRTDSKIYYGLTNNITTGLGYKRELERINDKYEYLESGKFEVIYNNFLFNYPYILVAEEGRVFNSIYDEQSKRDTKDKNFHIFKGQIDIDKVRLKAENENKDRYYSDKRKNSYSIEYRPFNGLEFEYEYEKKEYYKEAAERDSKFTTTYSKSFKNILISTEYEKSLREEDKYTLNMYYSGFRTFTTRWENKWENNGKDFETALTVFSSSNRILDYTVEARYSERDKDMITFRFNLKYDNWFNFDSFIDKKGNQEYKIGIDRITDLKNPKEKIENIDSSRVKVITFIDLNNNNILDDGEPKIDNVKVKIGNKEITTNKKGEGIFYGIPNHVTYNLNPTIRKPSFVIGNNKIKIKGRTSSTLIAYIPVKPLLTLTGVINIDPSLNKTQKEKMLMYSELLIKVKDLDGKVLDMSIPDETGIFEISGLLPKKYYLEVSYLGVTYKIGKLDEVIQLSYLNPIKNNLFAFNVLNDSIYLDKKEY